MSMSDNVKSKKQRNVKLNQSIRAIKNPKETALFQKNKELVILNRLAQKITAQLSLQKACQVAVKELADALSLDMAVLFLLEGDQLRIEAIGPTRSYLQPKSTPLHIVGECLCGLAARTGRPVFSNNIGKDKRCTWAECKKAGLHSFAAVPLRVRNKPLGILGFASAGERNFREVSHFLKTAANQVAISIHNAKQFEKIQDYSIQLERQVAALKRAENIIDDAVALNKAIFEASPIGIITYKASGQCASANESIAKMLGSSIDQLLKQNFYQIESWKISGMLELAEEALGKGIERTKDVHFVSTFGKEVWFSCRFIPFQFEEELHLLTLFSDITDRKKTEEVLGRYQVLAESSRDIILFIRRSDGKIIEANRAAAEAYGYTRDELMGMNVKSLRLPEEQPFVAGQMKQADDVGILFETRHVRKDGSLIPVEINARGITVNGERILLSIVRDITDRKQAEMELVREKQFTEKLLESLPGIFFLYDSTCHLKRWNKAHETAMGYTADELRDWYIPDWHEKPEDAAVGMALVKSVLETGVGGAFETTLLNKEGRFVPYLISITRLMTPDGPVMMGVGIDITERKKAEEALRVSEEKYRLVVENANDAILIVQDRMIKFQNHQLTTLTGYSEEELQKVSFDHFLHPADKEMVLETHRKRLQGQDVPAAYSFRIVTKSGESKWVEVSAISLAWEGRQATLNFLRDITIQKKLEEQLSHAQKMEAIGTLAGGIAHDFNNLLMGILGYTSLMLLKSDKTHPFYEKLKTLEELVESGSDLTKQLLGFARGGKYEVKPVDINALIIKTSEIFERTKKEITIHKKLREDIYAVEADAGQIEQVLMNLYVNAWQAMPSGGSLFLETQNAVLNELQSSMFNLNPGRYVKISVTDTGVGMDSETQKRIFEPFFTTKGIGKGTGLGLASAYGIIKNHGGIINVYSEKGHGTTFTIYLAASGARPLEAGPPKRRSITGHETILIVDDEPMNIGVIKELLEELGYRVLTSQSGREAVKLYRKLGNEIQLVVLDMIMPEMNGKETLIKLMGIHKDVRVLLSSGYSINGEAKSILDLGCKGFIQKPFRVEELTQKIREILDT